MENKRTAVSFALALTVLIGLLLIFACSENMPIRDNTSETSISSEAESVFPQLTLPSYLT